MTTGRINQVPQGSRSVNFKEPLCIKVAKRKKV